jgi:hypothetical protein
MPSTQDGPGKRNPLRMQIQREAFQRERAFGLAGLSPLHQAQQQPLLDFLKEGRYAWCQEENTEPRQLQGFLDKRLVCITYNPKIGTIPIYASTPATFQGHPIIENTSSGSESKP